MMSANNSEQKEPKTDRVPLSKVPRLLISRRWWWTTLLVLAGMVITFRLGIWQLDRLQQKRASNEAYIQQINSETLHLEGKDLPIDAEDAKDRIAAAEGSFDYDEQIVLVQQNYEGRPGGHLVAPFVFAGSDEAILVDRGWIPSHEIEQGDLKRFNDPGQSSVIGSLQPSQMLSGEPESEDDERKAEWYRIDIEAIQQQMPFELAPVYLVEKPAEEIQDRLPYKVEPEIDLSEGPHLIYAIQWFFFCALLTVGYIYFVRTRTPA